MRKYACALTTIAAVYLTGSAMYIGARADWIEIVFASMLAGTMALCGFEIAIEVIKNAR